MIFALNAGLISLYFLPSNPSIKSSWKSQRILPCIITFMEEDSDASVKRDKDALNAILGALYNPGQAKDKKESIDDFD